MAICLNAFLVWVYWTYAPIVLASEEGTGITLFEDFSGEIVNGTKHFGFQWSPSEGNETLLFDEGKILFSNGTVLLS
jgi:hypothetical protein